MRLINVSNRLPISISKIKGRNILERSIGGVATGLNSFLNEYRKTDNIEVIWVGWPGVSLKDDMVINEKLRAQDCLPVHIPDTVIDDYYHGFCNQTLWPLFHSLQSQATYLNEHWLAYQRVNQLFYLEIAKIIKPDDIIWIHDYHLFLLSKLLKEKFPTNNVGFFLHISFPSYDCFQFLPKACRDQLLHGMLGADLIGFHTHEYSQNFTRVVRRTLGYEQHMGYINTREKMIYVGAYPMGIDINAIQHQLVHKSTIEKREKLINVHRNYKVILSADRLDYTKGIINKLFAYQFFLETNQEWHEKVILSLIVAPSREELKSYSSVKKEIDEIVGLINGQFGNSHWAPIHYSYRSFTMEEMIINYSIADVAFITPIKDGMNLIAKEFVAAKKDKRGVLILSETAGAAKELLGALIVNPQCKLEMVYALKQALEMPEDEQEKRMDSMQKMLKKYNLANWGQKFLSDLLDTKSSYILTKDKFINHERLQKIQQDYKNAKSRLITLDYDGTLVPFSKDINMAIPSVETLGLISTFTQDRKNKVVIISGRDKNTLEKWFGHLGVTLVAEHSGWIKENTWRQDDKIATGWKGQIRSILQIFTDRLEGSFVEEKEFSIIWHYRNSDEGNADEMARELSDYLIAYTDESDLRVMSGKKSVEVKSSKIGKNFAIDKMLAGKQYDFFLAAGDDVSDEDMFIALPKDALTIKVGAENSHAKFHVTKPLDVVILLNSLQHV